MPYIAKYTLSFTILLYSENKGRQWSPVATAHQGLVGCRPLIFFHTNSTFALPYAEPIPKFSSKREEKKKKRVYASALRDASLFSSSRAPPDHWADVGESRNSAALSNTLPGAASVHYYDKVLVDVWRYRS